MDLPDPPEGWALKSLIELDEGSWSAQLWASEAYVYGYGSTVRYAMLDALARIESGDTFDRLSGGEKSHPGELVKALGIGPAKPREFDRRF